MAREATITQEQVDAIADAIRAAGAKPTARAVRERLGAGSMATVLRLLQLWQERQQATAGREVVLPAQVQRCLRDFVAEEVAAARADLETDLASVREAQADLIAEAERQARTIDALTAELDQARAETAALQGRLAQVTADLASAREEAAQERQAAQAARTELARAEMRLEVVPRLDGELERLREALDAERTRRTDAEQAAAVLSARLEEIRARADRDAEEPVRRRPQGR